MQPTPSGSGNFTGGGGGGSGVEFNRAELARFRSAPASWLEALLEGEEEEEEETLKPNQTLTQLLVSNTTPASRNSVPFGSSSSAEPGNLYEPLGFHRQNSSPADFLGNSGIESDGFFPNFAVPSNYDYLSPSVNVSSSSKRTREAELPEPAPKYPSLLKGGQTAQVPGGVCGLMDTEMEKLMEDSVPCRVRAKRGCATHPRSIAERVRRTRISDRIRKLQELVPNMDKQTNTADMLDEAVEYVKFLQKQIQELTEHRSRCTCVRKE